MRLPMTLVAAAALVLTVLPGCKRDSARSTEAKGSPGAAAAALAAAPAGALHVGIVTDVGGRGDQSFNDSALRGLELWAAGKQFSATGYAAAKPEDVKGSLPPELRTLQPPISFLNVAPMVLQSKSQEDYEPNLQLLVDQGSQLTIGTGFLLENAVESVAKRNPDARFLLIDSPLLDDQGKPYRLPNVRTVVFREEEGSYLAGALAGLVTKSGKVAFVGGMQIPLIQKFEAGFRAGLATTNPEAAKNAFVTYTGSFDNVSAGKQVAVDVVSKGADVVFHAAGSDGLGVIQAVKEARDSGKTGWVIGVDSDQWHVAPNVVLTSMVKHVDLAVYEAVRDLAHQKWMAGDTSLGLKEGGVALAEIRVEFPGKAQALAKVQALKAKIVSGEIHVPASPAQLVSAKGAP